MLFMADSIKVERRTRAAPTGPAKGLKKTAPGRRPFRGVAQVLLFLKHRRSFDPRLAGLLETVSRCSRISSDCQRAYTGPSLLSSESPGKKANWHRHAADAHH